MSVAKPAETEVFPPLLASDPVVFRTTDAVPTELNPADLLQVFVGTVRTCCEDRTPIAGQYIRTSDALMFSPAFGFEPEQDYVARVQKSGLEDQLVPFRLASKLTDVEARVSATYPSGDTIPENMLRFYIHFSTPMSPGVAFKHIKLRDEAGKADDAAFMRFKQELWNEDRTRLTVLIDPGRIKREVATNVELGPALLAGKKYTLSVEGDWPSANGQTSLASFSRTFKVSGALRDLPDFDLWKLNSPCRATKDPLTIEFDRPFDRHLLDKDIRVIGEGGQLMGGKIEISRGEWSWSFSPNEPWTDTNLKIEVNPTLEDVAANNFRDLLDHNEGVDVAGVSETTRTINLKSCAN